MIYTNVEVQKDNEYFRAKGVVKEGRGAEKGHCPPLDFEIFFFFSLMVLKNRKMHLLQII